MPKNWLSPSRHQLHLERGTTFVVLKAMAHVPIVTHCSFGEGDILTAGKSLTLPAAEPLDAPRCPGSFTGWFSWQLPECPAALLGVCW